MTLPVGVMGVCITLPVVVMGVCVTIDKRMGLEIKAGVVTLPTHQFFCSLLILFT